ncbi:hypothetical protein D9M68_942440 [compost metagenome]
MLGIAAWLANDSGGLNTRCSCITDSMADIDLSPDFGLALAAKLRPTAYLNLTVGGCRLR